MKPSIAKASPWWTPSVHADRRPFLIGRNRIQAALRGYFAREDFIEVDTATLQVSPGNEAHLHAFATEALTTDGQAAHAYVETRPALRMEEFFTENEALSLAGRLGGTRLPRLTDLARILLEFRREVAVPYAPAFLVKVALTPLAWLGRRTGFHKAAPQHGPD